MTGTTGISVAFESLRASCDQLRTAIGADRFDRVLNTFHPERAKGLGTCRLMRAQAHPLAVEWHGLQQEIEETEKKQTLCLSERSYFLLDSLVRLVSVLDLPGVE